MHSIYEFLSLIIEIEHDLEHDSKVLSLFSTPKIYDAKENLSKRWYLFFSFRNPKTANCLSRGNHFIQIVTTNNQWGCGYCKRKGGLIELKQWLEELKRLK